MQEEEQIRIADGDAHAFAPKDPPGVGHIWSWKEGDRAREKGVPLHQPLGRVFKKINNADFYPSFLGDYEIFKYVQIYIYM